ncbi:MAG: NHLP family bacteriocin export ABC transporter peptidase/permease/ATPase subunit, partial [Acidobacteriota bacterium]
MSDADTQATGADRSARWRGLTARWRGLTARWRRLRDAVRPPKGATQRVRAPTVLQMEAVECGAASLSIVLAHHGRWVPLEVLRQACGVSRDGSKASNVLKAARHYGLVAKGFKREPEQLLRLPMPAILHWNFNHFLVIEGFGRGGRVHLNDPASGPRMVAWEELERAFTGVVLVFKPSDGFEIERRPSRIAAFARRLKGTGVALAFIIAASVALVVPQLVTPVFPKIFLDQILLDGRYEWIRPLMIAMGLTALVIGVLTWIQQSALLRLETRLSLSASGRFMWHVLRLPVAFFNQRFAGDIGGRVAINDRVARLLSRDLATHSLNAATVIFFTLVMLTYDPLLTVCTLGLTAINIAALRLVGRARVDGSRRLQQDQGKMDGVSASGLGMIETLKATGSESQLFTRWAGYQAKVVNASQALARTTEVLNALPPLLAAINNALVLGLGSLRVMNGGLTLGGLLAFQVLVSRFTAPIQGLVQLGGTLQAAEADIARLDDVMRYPIDPETDADVEMAAGDAPKLAGRLTLRGVTFGYSPLAPPLIEDFDLDLEPGQRVALVGGSGSGKSTIARLIAGLHQPWKGEILFDGQTRAAIPRNVMQQSMAVVDQNVFLFAGTIRDNLTLWDPTVSMPDLIGATRDADIHEVIAGRSGGYDSAVDEGGTNFSGGQAQRLEIARALVARPSLLLLDEATSALDPTTEMIIDRNLRRRGCTCLIVAHRLSTIRDADEIIVLDRGQVVQRGTHDRLKDEDGLYARLIQDHCRPWPTTICSNAGLSPGRARSATCSPRAATA